MEFEVTTVSTLSIDATAAIVAWVEFSEENYLLFEIPGTGSATHEDILYPGLTYTFTASSESFFWNFTVDIEEQAVAVPALGAAGHALLLAALVATAMGAVGMGAAWDGRPGHRGQRHEKGESGEEDALVRRAQRITHRRIQGALQAEADSR